MATSPTNPEKMLQQETGKLFRKTLDQTARELEGRIRQLGDLRMLGALFSSATKLEDVTAQGLDYFFDSSSAENCSIMLYHENEEALCLLAAQSRLDPVQAFFGLEGFPKQHFKKGEGVAGHVLENDSPLVIGDVADDELFVPISGRTSIGSMACLPLFASGSPLGVVNLSHPDPMAIAEEDLPLWATMANNLGVAISNSILMEKLREENRRLGSQVDTHRENMERVNADLEEAHATISKQNRELKLKVREQTGELQTMLTDLKDKSEQLERANQIKDDFLNNINHELKTPLNAIIGYSGLLLMEVSGVISEEQKSDLELIEANGKHLQQIIENIFSLRDISSGDISPKIKMADINELISSSVASVAPRARQKGLDLNVLDGEVPPVPMDTTLIRRVIYNLLDNAIKFSSTGTITVSSKAAWGAEIGLACEGNGEVNYVVVKIADKGVGVAREDMERIFEKFQQAASATTKEEGGSGVGLTISKTLVELHNGRIWVEENTDGGATFSFCLPIARNS